MRLVVAKSPSRYAPVAWVYECRAKIRMYLDPAPDRQPTASPQLGSCCVGDFLAANSTGTNRPAAEAALLFLFQRRFFR